MDNTILLLAGLYGLLTIIIGLLFYVITELRESKLELVQIANSSYVAEKNTSYLVTTLLSENKELREQLTAAKKRASIAESKQTTSNRRPNRGMQSSQGTNK